MKKLIVNGKEIYEGDIINIKYQNSTIKNAIVEYKDASFYGLINNIYWKIYSHDEIEVVGNVYERDIKNEEDI